MRKIAILNQKGGVGKTTTAVNFSAGLARAGQKVCLFDLDPQAHATTHLGKEPDGVQLSMYDVLVNQKSLAETRCSIQDNLDLIGSDINLAAAEVELAGVVGREVILREALQADKEEYDYILMDCGPSLGVLTLNALSTADEVIIPLQPHFFALHGLSKLLETTSLVCRRINPSLRVSHILICLYETGTKLAQEVIRDLDHFLVNSRKMTVPWNQAQIFQQKIRRNIKLAECPSFGKSIFEYAPKSTGAQDYSLLVEEFLRSNCLPKVNEDHSKGAVHQIPRELNSEISARPIETINEEMESFDNILPITSLESKRFEANALEDTSPLLDYSISDAKAA